MTYYNAQLQAPWIGEDGMPDSYDCDVCGGKVSYQDVKGNPDECLCPDCHRWREEQRADQEELKAEQ